MEINYEATLLENVEFQTLFKAEAPKINIDELTDGIRKDIISNLITQFGLSKIFDAYQHGGDVTTLHNAKKNVFANREDERRYTQKYEHKNYEGRKDGNFDNRLSTQRKNFFQQVDRPKDAYTGKDLSKDGTTHLDHVTSAAKIHMKDEARLYMSDDERNDMAVAEPNMAFTNSSLNQSKGEEDAMKWYGKTAKGQTQINGKRFDVNKEALKEKYDQSNKFINKTVRNSKHKYYITETSKAALKQGARQARKQIAGILLFEVCDVFFEVTMPVLKRWNDYSSIKERFQEVKDNFLEEIGKAKERIINLALKLRIGASNSFISGVFSTIVNVLINTFMTTTKIFAKLLNDGIMAITRSIKILRNSELTMAERRKQAIKIIGTGILASLGIILAEVISKQLLGTPFAPFADLIGLAISGILTGIVSACFIFTVENFGSICLKIKDSFALIKYGATVTSAQIEADYQRVIAYLDDAYQEILVRIQKEYQRINDLQKMMSDFSQLAEQQFQNSIVLAVEMNVPAEKILKTKEAIDDYFLG